MDIKVILLIEIFLDAKLLAALTHHGQCRLDRLLHHLTELAGGHGLALAGHGHGFDGEQFATDLGPCQACDLADLVFLLGNTEGITPHPQVFVEVPGIDDHLGLALPQHQGLDHLAADLGNVTVERAHTGLTCVVAHDVAQRIFGHRQFIALDAIGLELLG